MTSRGVVAIETSPLPWSIEHNGRARTDIAAPEETTGGYLILTMNPDAPCREANAQLIVQAVNSHAELVEALEQSLHCLASCQQAIDTPNDRDTAGLVRMSIQDHRARIQAALAATRGGK